MKLSVGDPGSFDVEVYLDGEKCDLCIMADEEEGVAEVYFQDFQEIGVQKHHHHLDWIVLVAAKIIDNLVCFVDIPES